jgi:hypothetical protein
MIDIHIQTTGEQGSGKTRMLAAIVHALTDAGIIGNPGDVQHTEESNYSAGPGYSREAVSFKAQLPREKTSRELIFAEIEKERAYQTEKWGVEADDTLNTPWMWTSYICQYAAKWMTGLFTVPKASADLFRQMMIKTGAICFAAVESLDRQRAANGRAFYEDAE